MAVTPVTKPLHMFNPKDAMDTVAFAKPGELIEIEQTCRALLRLEDNHREYQNGWFRSVFLVGSGSMPQAPERIGRFRMTVMSLLQRVAAVETEARMENARVDRERARDAQARRDAAWLADRDRILIVLASARSLIEGDPVAKRLANEMFRKHKDD